MIEVNEQPVPFKQGMLVKDLVATVKPDADLLIVNGFVAQLDTKLGDGDSCWLIKRGEIPSPEEMERLLYARHTPGVHQRLRKAVVGILGLGGLGSAVAVALARMGIGKLVLADYDVVEPTNLNRQQYFIDQIGMKKTDALRENLTRINPYVAVETIDEVLTEESIVRHFKAVDALAECFDDAAMKATALRAALRDLKEVYYVGSSGVAGIGKSNDIKTKMIFPDVFLVGDGEAAAAPGQGLMATRVGIAAHHQANQIVSLLLGAGE